MFWKVDVVIHRQGRSSHIQDKIGVGEMLLFSRQNKADLTSFGYRKQKNNWAHVIGVMMY